MFREGLGENSEFGTYDPVVGVVYFAIVIIVTMFANHPAFLAMSAAASFSYLVLLRGMKGTASYLKMCLVIMVFMVVINGLFTHSGATVLFYIGDNAVTREAFIYGFAASVMLCSVIMWFACSGVIVTSEKFSYVFGRAMPVLALTISMIFRFIPLLKKRFREIHEGQMCMGRNTGEKGLIERIRQFGKEISILISWSLETSIDTSDSMEARGYGLRGRTSFYLFRFTRKDAFMLAVICAAGVMPLAALIHGSATVLYYPVLDVPEPDVWFTAGAAGYLALLFLPFITDVIGEVKWKRLDSRA
ncbi:MAG: energy-coupling factor transporter transmembrane component T [Anaerovoracaceae bacterium]